jgi:APA family basic amino acid/polyamine antiporter
MQSSTPLINAASTIYSYPPLLQQTVVVVIGIGALVSIMGSDESGTIGTSRLTYAMSVSGLLPHALSKKHPRFDTPYLAIIILCSLAFIASVFGGLAALINFSVFLMALAYLSTCISAFVLARRNKEKAARLKGRIIIPVLGALFCVLLILLVNPVQIAIAMLLLLIGIPVYAFFSPKKELKDLREALHSEEAVMRRLYYQGRLFLAYPLLGIKSLIYRLRGISSPYEVSKAPDNEK